MAVIYTSVGRGGGDGSEAEAVNCPLAGRRMAPLHQRLQRRSCSNVTLYGAPWQPMTTCKCNLPQKWPMRARKAAREPLGGQHPGRRGSCATGTLMLMRCCLPRAALQVRLEPSDEARTAWRIFNKLSVEGLERSLKNRQAV